MSEPSKLSQQVVAVVLAHVGVRSNNEARHDAAVNIDALLSELQSQLAQATQERDMCWHCGIVLINVPKPRCEGCPDECDVVNCDAIGCLDKLAQQHLDSWK